MESDDIKSSLILFSRLKLNSINIILRNLMHVLMSIDQGIGKHFVLSVVLAF